MVCLDTNFLIDLIKKKQEALSKLRSLNSTGMRLSTTTITASELYAGAFQSKYTKQGLAEVNAILDTLRLLTLTRDSAEIYGVTNAHLQSIGKKSQDLDMLIASIVMASTETLLTKNTEDFENIKELKIETW